MYFDLQIQWESTFNKACLEKLGQYSFLLTMNFKIMLSFRDASKILFRYLITTVFLAFVAVSVSAQKRELVQGSLNGLKAQKSYNIEFTYDDIIVGKHVPEKQYLEDKRQKWNELERGKGDDFVENWFNARERLYEPAFIVSFEKFAHVKLEDERAPYTLILKTRHIEGGWNLGIATHGGEMSGELWIVETADPKKVVAIITLFECRGKDAYGGDFEMPGRIRSAYESAGKWLGEFIRRKAK